MRHKLEIQHFTLAFRLDDCFFCLLASCLALSETEQSCWAVSELLLTEEVEEASFTKCWSSMADKDTLVSSVRLALSLSLPQQPNSSLVASFELSRMHKKTSYHI